MSLTLNYPFTTPSNYTYDDTKINDPDGSVDLKLQDVAAAFTEDFADDTDFTYDNTKSEFSGGKVQQKDTRPSNAIHYTSFTTDQNNVWPAGQTANSLVGGATVSGGRCDLTGRSGKRLNMTAGNGFNAIGTAGCIRFTYVPDYNGTPSATDGVLEFDAATGNNNAIFITINTGGSFIIDVRDSSGSAHQFVCSGITFVQGQSYVCELNFDFDSNTRFFVDGLSRGSLNTSSWTRAVESGTFKWGGATGTGDFYIDDIIVFDAVQHTSNHAGELPYSYNETIYVNTAVTLPEMEHTGDGTIVSFTSLVTTESGTPKYTLQIGRSGNYLYWNGSAWATSDGSYTQSTDAATFTAQGGSLPVSGEIYGQFRIHFPDSNTINDIDELTANMIVELYSTSNPTIQPSAIISMEALEGFTETATKTGSDEVKYVLYKNNAPYYYNSGWVTSNETYSQANTAAEIETNKTTFTTTGVNFTWKAFLHSDNGQTTPDLDNVAVTYDFFSSAETINKCIVYGYMYKADGSADTTSFKVRLSANAIKYGAYSSMADDEITITPNSSGYWEQELVETANMPDDVYYEFVFTNSVNRVPTETLISKNVPNESTKAFWELTDA